MKYRVVQLMMRILGTYRNKKRLGHLAYIDGYVFSTNEQQMLIYHEKGFTAKGKFGITPDDLHIMPGGCTLSVDEGGWHDEHGNRYGFAIEEYPDLRETWKTLDGFKPLTLEFVTDARRVEQIISPFKAARIYKPQVAFKGPALMFWGATEDTEMYGATVCSTLS